MWIRLVLLSLIAAAAVIKLITVFRLNIGWDEFRYLFLIYEHVRGTLVYSFQSIHVHLFGWLTHLPGNEIDQITAARLVYYGFGLATGALVFGIARRFFSGTASLFAVLCYFSYWEVIRYGGDFRADGLAVMLFMAAVLALVGNRIVAQSILAGILIALALLITIKSVFYLPTVAALFAIRLYFAEQRRPLITGAAIFAASLAVTFGLLFLLHKSTLDTGAVVASDTFLRSSGSKVIILDDLFPRWWYFLSTVIHNPLILIILAGGLWILVSELRNPERSESSLLLLALLLPLGSLLIYRNAFPYYYVFVVPPALVLCGAGFDYFLRKLHGPTYHGALILLCVMIGGVAWLAGIWYFEGLRDEVTPQRAVVEAMHRVFPEPVPYIDAMGMVASFPSVGFFMSTWGIEKYRAAGTPVFPRLLQERKPAAFLANDSVALSAIDENARSPWGEDYEFLELDKRVLRNNFVHHWGPLYVAGKHVEITDFAATRFDLLIPGIYTVEASDPVLINGVLHESGSKILLTSGEHQARSALGSQVLTLRWGVDLYRPTDAPPSVAQVVTDF